MSSAGKKYVICALMGGLGNQMFQYAAARALAQRMGQATDPGAGISDLSGHFSTGELASKRGSYRERGRSLEKNRKGGAGCFVACAAGDYTVGGRFSLLPLKAIRKQLECFTRDWPVVILSDDRDRCRSIFQEPRFTVHVGGSAIEDLFVMAHADHHVIANSTFSWRRLAEPQGWQTGDRSSAMVCGQGRPWKKQLVPPGWEICPE